MGLDIFDDRFQTLGKPFVLVVDQLLPDIDVDIADVEVTKLALLDQGAGDKVGQKRDHVALR